MKVQNNRNNQPNFGIKIVQTKPFERFAKAKGWEEAIGEISQRLEAKFPDDKRVFELRSNHVLAEEHGDIYGATYQFAPQKGDFNSTKQIERAIIKTVAGKKAMESLPEHVKRLSKKYRINVDYSPSQMSHVAGNDAQSVARIISGVAKGVAGVPVIQPKRSPLGKFISKVVGDVATFIGSKKRSLLKQNFDVKIYNSGSSGLVTVKLRKGENTTYEEFLLRGINPITEERVASRTKAMIDYLKHGSSKSKKRKRTSYLN